MTTPVHLDKMCLLIVFLAPLFQFSYSTVVHEVQLGALAILDCPSNVDADHRFQYWQLNNDQNVVGPENDFDRNKYSYEVWSGRLIINSVSTAETGLYNCISKHITSANLNVKTVELVVKKDWEELFEDDPQANAYRTTIGILVVLILLLLGGIGFFMARQRRSSRSFFSMSREESPEVPTTGTYNPTTTSKRDGSSKTSNFGNINRDRSPRPSRVLDTAIVETDLKTSFSLPDYD